MNRYLLNDEVREKFTPIIKEYLDKVENVTAEQMEHMSNEELGLELSDKGINPSQLNELLKTFGYKETDMDRNGWQMDFWINMARADGKQFPSGCEKLVISGCGMTFSLKLWIDGIDF